MVNIVMTDIEDNGLLLFIALTAILPCIFVIFYLCVEIKGEVQKKEHEVMQRNQYGLPRIQSTYKAKR
jgi:hypothetical protein